MNRLGLRVARSRRSSLLMGQWRVAALAVVLGWPLACGGKSVTGSGEDGSRGNTGGSTGTTSGSGGSGGSGEGETSVGGSGTSTGGDGGKGTGGDPVVTGGGSESTSSVPGATTVSLPPRGNSSGAGGSGGSAGSGVEGVIGRDCESEADCDMGLDCLTPDSDALGSGGPAHGICTFACAPGGADCEGYDSNSTCVEFDWDIAYCMRQCTPGAEDDKCLGRMDTICDKMACALDYPDACEGIDCVSERCDPGGGQATVCLPRCNTDDDCPAGRHCDHRRGFCSSEMSTGKRFGESCTPGANQCAGWCDPDYEVCLEACALGVYPSCASESVNEGSAACLLVFEGTADVLDAGTCAGLCDCSTDCFAGLGCLALEDSAGPFELLGRPGVCTTLRAGDTELVECP